ncbi:hypothetical protein O6P43_011203 [Quillaja saponaria]|uniref:Uncharacterized protein n=1 Tax=Quillaja saponaria TaxID=32244 RepID=A0AAD7Q254_QUISA|nr:hypothetical protein O6P43_011203 [Quillaja saponaria]
MTGSISQFGLSFGLFKAAMMLWLSPSIITWPGSESLWGNDAASLHASVLATRGLVLQIRAVIAMRMWWGPNICSWIMISRRSEKASQLMEPLLQLKAYSVKIRQAIILIMGDLVPVKPEGVNSYRGKAKQFSIIKMKSG